MWMEQESKPVRYVFFRVAQGEEARLPEEGRLLIARHSRRWRTEAEFERCRQPPTMRSA